MAQQQGLLQPEPAFQMDSSWAPFSMLALIYLCLCVPVCILLHRYLYTHICVGVVSVFALLRVLNLPSSLEFRPSEAQLHDLQMENCICVKSFG